MLFSQPIRRAGRALKFRFLVVASIFLMLLMGLLLQQGPASAAEERFKNPKVNGYALDYCRSWAKDCGKPAADAWCKKKGYKRALRHEVKKDSPPTIVIRSGKICNEPFCDRISFVACEAEEGTRGTSSAGGDVIIPQDEFEVDE